MGEPTEEEQADFLKSASAFWTSTPLTLLLGKAFGASGKTVGTSLGDIGGYFLPTLAASKALKGLTDNSTIDWKGYVYARLRAFGVTEEDAEAISKYIIDANPGGDITGWIMQFVSAIALNAKMMMSVMGVVDQTVAKAINRSAALQPGDFTSLYRHKLISGGQKTYGELVGDLGHNADWLKVMETGQFQIANPTELGELLRRGILKPEDYIAGLRRNGYEQKAEQTRLLALTRILVPPAVSLELGRRGVLKPKGVKEALAQHGFDSDASEALVEAGNAIPGISEIIPLMLHGYITKNEATAMLAKHGYSNDDLYKLLDLGKRPQTEEQLTRLHWRNRIDNANFIKGLMKLGYRKDDANDILGILYQPPSPSDMVRFAVREVYSPDVAAKFKLYDEFPEQFAREAHKQGIAPDTAKQYWAAHWTLPSPGQGFDMYHRGIITHDELSMLLRVLDVNPFWRERMIKLADRQIPRRTLRQLLREDVETPTDLMKRYIKLGYSIADATALTAVDVSIVETDLKDITKAEAIRAFIHGFATDAELQKWLIQLEYSKDAVAFYTADAKRQKYLHNATADAKPNQAMGEKALGKLTDVVVKQYQAGMTPRKDTYTLLINLGYYPETAEFFLQQADLEQYETDMEYYANEIRKMMDADAIDSHEALRLLIGKGYDVTAAERLVSRWDFAYHTEEKAKAAKEAKEVKATKAEMKRWTSKGIVSVDEYDNYLTDLGYDAFTRQNYIVELMLDLET